MWSLKKLVSTILGRKRHRSREKTYGHQGGKWGNRMNQKIETIYKVSIYTIDKIDY